jgi:predicted nucleotidyltransferase
MDNSLLVDQIRSILGGMTGISLAYLFGSQVAGTAGTMSDVDLGILLENRNDAGRAYSVLTYKLNKGLGSAQVDVVLLHQAPIELAYAIIAQGACVFQQDTFTRVEYEADVLSRYGDYLPVLRAQREEILGGETHDRRVQRYREALRRTERALGAIRAAQK